MQKTNNIKRFLILLTLFAFGSLTVLSLNQRRFEESAFQARIEGYRRLLEKFINQDWSIIAIRNDASMTVSKELSHFVNKDSECIRFYYDGREVGSYGNCLLTNHVNASSLSFGWSSHQTNIFLHEKYRKGVSIILAMDNHESFEMIEGKVNIPLLMRHITESFHLFVLSLILFSLGYLIYFVIQKIREQREESRNKVHDFSNLASDDQSIADELELIAKYPNAILALAKRIRRASVLKKSVLYNGPADRIEDHNLFELINEFCDGFFETKDQSVFFMNTFNTDIYVKVDKRLFQRVMSNLFDNAFKSVVIKEKFCLSVLQYTDQVEILVSNKGEIQNFNKVFKLGFSNRSSSGRGLYIIDDTVSKMGSEIYLIQGGNEISFSFCLPIVKEKSWPALYA